MVLSHLIVFWNWTDEYYIHSLKQRSVSRTRTSRYQLNKHKSLEEGISKWSWDFFFKETVAFQLHFLTPLLSFVCVSQDSLWFLSFFSPSSHTYSTSAGDVAGSQRSALAHSLKLFELPSHLRPPALRLWIPAWRLLGCWPKPNDLPPSARTLSKGLSLWLGYHLFRTHLAMPPSWPSLNSTVSRHYKWMVSKSCQPCWCFYDSWEEGAANHTVTMRHSSLFRSLTWIKLFEPGMHRVMCHLIKKSLTFCNFFKPCEQGFLFCVLSDRSGRRHILWQRTAAGRGCVTNACQIYPLSAGHRATVLPFREVFSLFLR